MGRMRQKLRSLMAIVALSALGLALAIGILRSGQYRDLASHHLQVMVNLKMGPARVRYHAAMFEKYRSAARSPWLAVGPDPPPPPFWGEAANEVGQQARSAGR